MWVTHCYTHSATQGIPAIVTGASSTRISGITASSFSPVPGVTVVSSKVQEELLNTPGATYVILSQLSNKFHVRVCF